VKLTSLLTHAAAAALLATAVFAAAQTPQDQPAAPSAAAQPEQGMRRMRNFPPPTNLKVLPKDMTGAQVRDVMEKWAGSLGVHCDFCHQADPNNVGPNGRPRLNFADDSKPNKQIARIMYTMTQQINADYIKKAMDLDTDNMGAPVACGTCHRGHKMPEEFVIPREERRGPGGGPGGPPADAAPTGGALPPASN
jgi:Photosynthetic reaction centre cytochrome C subunit